MDEDAIQVTGLSIMLDDDPQPPYLELSLRTRRRVFQAAVLAVKDEWALVVRDERGVNRTADGELWPTQTAAILAAMLTAIDLARQMPLD